MFVNGCIDQLRPSLLVLTGPRVPHNWISNDAAAAVANFNGRFLAIRGMTPTDFRLRAALRFGNGAR